MKMKYEKLKCEILPWQLAKINIFLKYFLFQFFLLLSLLYFKQWKSFLVTYNNPA